MCINYGQVSAMIVAFDGYGFGKNSLKRATAASSLIEL